MVKLINTIKKYKTGIWAGALVGLAAALSYKYFVGDFTFVYNSLTGRSADAASLLASLPNFQSAQLIFFVTAVAWVIIGAVLGIIVDKYFGLKFSQKTKRALLIIGSILVVYSLYLSFGGTTDISREAGIGSAIGSFANSNPITFSFIFYTVFSAITGAISSIFNPQPTIPIWIFFVIGFVLLLFLRRSGGQQEQPIIIQR